MAEHVIKAAVTRFANDDDSHNEPASTTDDKIMARPPIPHQYQPQQAQGQAFGANEGAAAVGYVVPPGNASYYYDRTAWIQPPPAFAELYPVGGQQWP